LESEVFGHEKGAFTGADRAKAGLIESADGGTVFLDEVGELSPNLQAKLLRVLEQREVLRVGALSPRPVNVRFVSATNRDLEEEAKHGRFRSDLYFRLSGVTVQLPPLRERKPAIRPLAMSFLSQVSRELGSEPELGISDRALELLESYDWPGNVRELRNVIERGALLATGDRVEVEHLPLDKLSSTWSKRAPASASTGGDPRAAERARIQEALAACAGNQTRAATALGISRRTLANRMIELGIPRPRKN
jgi:transcriptional regulator with PAS, ATPase and Fis domain